MRRPKGHAGACFEVMVPARDEAHNLGHLLPSLKGCTVTVFDDESSDGTGEIASSLGAKVVQPGGSLPPGWTGKARACQTLADLATEDWVVFLDADTRPGADFVAGLSSFLASLPPKTEVVTGFPRMLPGSGLEPGYLFWVPWILLATNPFGLVARTGLGHNMFLNGQFSAWRRETLARERPFEAVRDKVLDDVNIGRLLARHKVRVEVIDVSRILEVKMYPDLRSAFLGMTKNTAEVIPGPMGWAVFALLLAVLGWVWLTGGSLWWVFGLVLLGSGGLVNSIVKMPFWCLVSLPLSLLSGAWTSVVSAVRRSRGELEWKGRRV